MLATQNEAIQRQQPWDYYRDNLGISNITQKEEFADFSYEPIAREFRWAEQVYQAGDTVAIVAVYKNFRIICNTM